MNRTLFIAAAGLGLLLAACTVLPPPQADPTRFYLIDVPPPPPAPASTGALRLGLKSVTVAGYLEGRTMAVRDGANELKYEDYERWAEPLDTGIARVLKETLLSDPSIGRVYVQPVPFDSVRDYDVSVVILRCEGRTEAAGSSASFAAAIEITTPGVDSKLVARKVFTAPDESWDGRNFGQLAALLSGDAAALGRFIVAALPPAQPGATN